MGSTPTEQGFSRIERAYDRSSKGQYVLTCPHCDGEHIRMFREPEEPIVIREREMKVSFLRWDDGDPDSAQWVCPDCGSLIPHSEHRRMMAAGYWFGDHWEWHADTGFTFLDGFRGTIGFRIWAGYSYSPNSTPAKLVNEFLSVKDDHEELKTFVNTVLGEAWEEKGEKVSSHALHSRCEKFPSEVPAGGWYLTLGADVQADRIECEIVAWSGENRFENWSVDYQILVGDPTQEAVWEDLEDLINAPYEHESGATLNISGALIDSGYLPKHVYAFSKRMGPTVLPAKGITGTGRPIVESQERRVKRLRKARKKGIKPELIGVDEGKSVVYRQLRLLEAGPGYCHFPTGRDEEFFNQLTAEKLVTRYRKGRAMREWIPTRLRNEALDCRVLNLAAYMLFAPDEIKPPKPKTEPAKKRVRRRSQSAPEFAPDDWDFG